MVGIRERKLRRVDAKHPDLRAAYEAKLEDVKQWRHDIIEPSAVEAVRVETSELLADVETQLADGRAFVMGERYTLADVLMTVSLARLVAIGRASWRSDGAHPHLVRYYERVRARPSFEVARVWERLHADQIAGIMLPFVLPRVAAAAAVIAVVTWAVVTFL